MNHAPHLRGTVKREQVGELTALTPSPPTSPCPELRAAATDVRNKAMTTLREIRCEVCGIVTGNPIRRFVIRCGDSELTVHRLSSEIAEAAGARHYLRGSQRRGVHQSLV